jgi:hypothetical protein
VPKKRQKQSSPAADDAAAAAAAAAAGAPPFATTKTTMNLTEKDSIIDTSGAAVATMTDVTTKDPTIDASAATTKETTIDTGAAIATNLDLSKKNTTIDTSAATTKDTTFNTNADIAKTANLTSNIDERKSPYRIPKKAKTTMPDINNAAMMTGTPIGATLPTGSVADHDAHSSVYVAKNDVLGQTTKGNKKVSIIYDMFLIPKWN